MELGETRGFAKGRTAAYLSAAACLLQCLWLLRDLSLNSLSQTRSVIDGIAVLLLGLIGAVALISIHDKANDDRYRRLVELSPDGIMVHCDGTIVFANSKLAELCGAASESELIGTPAINYVAPEERKRVIELRKQIPVGGPTNLSDGKFIRLDGSIAHVERAGAAINWDGKPSFLVMVRNVTERKLTEDALEESERRYSGIAANIPGAIFQRIRHPDGRITFPYVSQGVRETHGVEASEVMTDPDVLLRIIHPEDRAAFHETLAASVNDQEPLTFEVRNIKPNGESVWIQTTQRPQRREDGTVIWDGMFVDITQQKQMEVALAGSEERYRKLLDLSPDAVYVHKMGQIVLINSAALKIFGAKSPDQIIGRNSLDLIHPEHRDFALTRQRDAAKEGTATVSMEQKRLRLDGTLFEAEVAATAIDWEGERGGIVVVRDITEKKRGEDLLRRAEELLRDAVESIPDGLVLFDREDRLLMWNRQFVELYPELTRLMVPGTTAEQLFRERVQSQAVGELGFLIDEYVRRRMEMRKIGSGAPFVHRHRDGRWFRTTERKTSEGGIVATTTDVTELKNGEIGLRAAKEEAESANRAKSEFLANMSHEIRTPMNGVLGMVSILLDSDLTPDQRKHAEIIKQSGASLMSILNDILDLSKVEAGHVEIETLDFDLRDLFDTVEAVWQSRLESNGLAYSTEIAPQVETILRSDPTRIRQILVNLISNGAKFTESGGVTIRVSQTRQSDTILVTRFEVTDTGIGISPAAQNLIFSKFAQADSSTTRKYGGTGLGLAISQQLAELMGGEMGFDSAEGKGSTFWFTINCTAGNRDSVTADIFMREIDEFQPDEPQRSLNILVAEDNSVNQAVIRALLDKAGHQFKIVENGVEAVNSVTATRYDMVLMDVQMPDMDGVTATKKIRNLPGDAGQLPIIALTANAMKGDRESYIEAGMTDYVPKPIDPNELTAVINRNRFDDDANTNHGSEDPVANDTDHSSPNLDLDVLNTLTEAVGEDVMPDLIAGSIHEMRTILERIIALGDGADLAALRRVAHDMKSSSGGFGAVRLQTVARDLEWASRDNRPDDARKLVQIIGAIGDEAFETLEAHAAKGTSESVKRAVNE